MVVIGVRLRCQRCSHIWVYRGKNEYKAPCPHCGSSVYITKNRIPFEASIL